MNHIVKRGETLAIIAGNYRRSMKEILAANSGITNPAMIFPGQKVVIPRLPDPKSIPYTVLVSLGRKTLTLSRNGQAIKTYPIAIGKMLSGTPTGDYVIVNREPNPGGPYGAMWLSLSNKGYGIHGTNNPASIGKAVSAGCIRMFNQDVLELAQLIPNGTRVTIRP